MIQNRSGPFYNPCCNHWYWNNYQSNYFVLIIWSPKFAFLISDYCNKFNMAQHKSALKRIRSSETKRIRNRYQAKTTRTFMKKLRTTSDKSEAIDLLKKVSSMLDKLAKKNILHKNTAANKKSSLTKYVNSLS